MDPRKSRGSFQQSSLESKKWMGLWLANWVLFLDPLWIHSVTLGKSIFLFLAPPIIYLPVKLFGTETISAYSYHSRASKQCRDINNNNNNNLILLTSVLHLTLAVQLMQNIYWSAATNSLIAKFSPHSFHMELIFTIFQFSTFYLVISSLVWVKVC